MKRRFRAIAHRLHRGMTRYPFAMALLQRLRGYHLQFVALEYPVDVKHPRYGYARPPHEGLTALFGGHQDRIVRNLASFANYEASYAQIPGADAGSGLPFWENRWLPPLDGVALYGFLASRNPRRYVEIGSGNSTKFARKAVTDHKLRTELISIDPRPRAEINVLCDQSIRMRFEDVDAAFFRMLEPDDIVFFDGSHRCFTNSDVTVFFLELLPSLPARVLVHIHDIYLPYDYPPNTPYYSEQYVLAAYLLAGARVDIEMPNAFVGHDPVLRELAARCLPNQEPADVCADATSFWFSTGSGSVLR